MASPLRLGSSGVKLAGLGAAAMLDLNLNSKVYMAGCGGVYMGGHGQRWQSGCLDLENHIPLNRAPEVGFTNTVLGTNHTLFNSSGYFSIEAHSGALDLRA